MVDETQPSESTAPDPGPEAGKTGSQRPPQAPSERREVSKGLWRSVDQLLREPEIITDSIAEDRNLWSISRILLFISVVMAAIYGMVMGATNLLQGANIGFEYKILQILISGIKVPVLFLLTIIIVAPPVYVSNAFGGAKSSFRQMIAAMCAANALMVTVLASMSTVVFFFALTSRSYHFIKLLHVAFFLYAGLTGISFLVRCLRMISRGSSRSASTGLIYAWLLLYMFVGTQLAWVLRPFVGSPGEPFQVFRPRTSNIYESVLYSIDRLVNDFGSSPQR